MSSLASSFAGAATLPAAARADLARRLSAARTLRTADSLLRLFIGWDDDANTVRVLSLAAALPPPLELIAYDGSGRAGSAHDAAAAAGADVAAGDTAAGDGAACDLSGLLVTAGKLSGRVAAGLDRMSGKVAGMSTGFRMRDADYGRILVGALSQLAMAILRGSLGEAAVLWGGGEAGGAVSDAAAAELRASAAFFLRAFCRAGGAHAESSYQGLSALVPALGAGSEQGERPMGRPAGGAQFASTVAGILGESLPLVGECCAVLGGVLVGSEGGGWLPSARDLLPARPARLLSACCGVLILADEAARRGVLSEACTSLGYAAAMGEAGMAAVAGAGRGAAAPRVWDLRAGCVATVRALLAVAAHEGLCGDAAVWLPVEGADPELLEARHQPVNATRPGGMSGFVYGLLPVLQRVGLAGEASALERLLAAAEQARKAGAAGAQSAAAAGAAAVGTAAEGAAADGAAAEGAAAEGAAAAGAAADGAAADGAAAAGAAAAGAAAAGAAAEGAAAAGAAAEGAAAEGAAAEDPGAAVRRAACAALPAMSQAGSEGAQGRRAQPGAPGGGGAAGVSMALVKACCNPRCGNLAGPHEAGLKLLRCAGCRVARYCGPECQRQHWIEEHKLHCRRG